MIQPSPNGDNGRDGGGRFVKGNAGGPGNPHAASVARLRARIVEAVTDGDLADVVRALVQAAKAGEPWAVRELLDRLIGKPKAADDDAGDGGDGRMEIIVRHVDFSPHEQG